MIYIASKDSEGRNISLKEITEATHTPLAFSAKILQQLSKSDLLISFKGPHGGFQLGDPKEIKLLDILLAIDGPKLLNHCVLGLEECSEQNPCPVHNDFIQIRNLLKETLSSVALSKDPSLFEKFSLR